jgi:predicted nuclease of predicted toxin-antitoxin system
MAIRFYCDEHIDLAIANALRKRGVDVLTAQEAGLLGVPDQDHLQLAISQNRVILTQDTDFLRMHKLGVSHSGIVYAHQSASISKMIQGALLIFQAMTEDEMTNHVEYL